MDSPHPEETDKYSVNTSYQSENAKFNHSIPVPPLYKYCTKILASYLEFKGRLNKLIFDSPARPRLQGSCSSFLYKLEPKLPLIKTIVENVGLLQKNDRLGVAMAYAIVGDLLFNNENGRLKSECKPVQAVLEYKEEIIEEYNICSTDPSLAVAGEKPRWVKVNNMLTTLAEVKSYLDDLGWYMACSSPNSYDEFLQDLDNLNPGEYLEDYHIPGLLAFPARASLTNTHLFTEGKILLQDKASCLPPFVSDVRPNQVVVDSCAAPGNKSILLASLLKSRGRLICVERDVDRFVTLKNRLKAHGVKRVYVYNEDFTEVLYQKLEGADTVLVDPSCSNSGIGLITDEQSASNERLYKLCSMQCSLLSYALSIPGVQTVVYSTCSVHSHENEEVVSRVLERHPNFELEDLSQRFKDWKHFGDEQYDFANKVLRTDSKTDRCHGFFVAKFVVKEQQECCEDEEENVEKHDCDEDLNYANGDDCVEENYRDENRYDNYDDYGEQLDNCEFSETRDEIENGIDINGENSEIRKDTISQEKIKYEEVEIDHDSSNEASSEKKKKKEKNRDILKIEHIDDSSHEIVIKKKKSKKNKERIEDPEEDGRVESSTKKKKRNLENEDELTNEKLHKIDMVEKKLEYIVRHSSNDDISIKKSKKKKKDKEKNESLIIVSEDSTSETGVAKKKRKRTSEIGLEDFNEPIEDCSTNKKDKKRRKKDKEDSSNNDNGLTNKKDKKRRKKDKEDSSNNDNCLTNKKDKKRRKKDRDDTSSNDVCDVFSEAIRVEDEEHQCERKKSKKIDYSINCADEETTRRKKKKSKKIDEEILDSCEERDASSNQAVLKQKKKKKREKLREN